MLAIGSIGDIAGHQRVILAGIGLFSGGAIVCAVAPGVLVLVLGRAAQGVAAAMLLTAPWQ